MTLLLFMTVHALRPAPSPSRGVATVVAELPPRPEPARPAPVKPAFVPLPPLETVVQAAAPPAPVAPSAVVAPQAVAGDFALPVEPLPALDAELTPPLVAMQARDELRLADLRHREMGLEELSVVGGFVAIEPGAGAESLAGLAREEIEARGFETGPTPPMRAPRQPSASVFPPPGEVPMPRGTALVSIIIDDVGPAQAWSARAIALPGPLTMSFLPYAEALPQQTDDARRRGHEIFLHMPMQPLGDANPGRNALRIGMDAADIRERVGWAIERVGSAVGMNNHMGSRMTADAPAMQVVMEVLREHGLMFVDSRTSPNSVAEGVAAAAGLPHTGRDVFLDHFPGPAFVRRQLGELEARARRTGSAVAIGHPLPTTIDVLEEWIPAAKARGLRFVKASQIIAARGCDGRSPAGKCGLLHAAGQRAAPDGG